MAGTPVKSCMITRAGLKGNSRPFASGAFHAQSDRTSSSRTSKPFTWRSTDSRRILMENGMREIFPSPCASSFSRLKKSKRPCAVFRVLRVPKGSCVVPWRSPSG